MNLELYEYGMTLYLSTTSGTAFSLYPITTHPAADLMCSKQSQPPSIDTTLYPWISLFRTGEALDKNIDPCILQSSDTTFCSPLWNSICIFFSFRSVSTETATYFWNLQNLVCVIQHMFQKFSSTPFYIIQLGLTCSDLAKNTYTFYSFNTFLTAFLHASTG